VLSMEFQALRYSARYSGFNSAVAIA